MAGFRARRRSFTRRGMSLLGTGWHLQWTGVITLQDLVDHSLRRYGVHFMSFFSDRALPFCSVHANIRSPHSSVKCSSSSPHHQCVAAAALVWNRTVVRTVMAPLVCRCTTLDFAGAAQELSTSRSSAQTLEGASPRHILTTEVVALSKVCDPFCALENRWRIVGGSGWVRPSRRLVLRALGSHACSQDCIPITATQAFS